MFNVGGGELLVILLIALVVLGPTRLPDAARTIGKTMGELRRLSSSFQNEVRTAINTADDPNQVATRRNVLSSKEPDAETASDTPAAPDAHPRRTKPLVAAPAPTDDAAAKPAGPKKSPTAKTAAAKNGTEVQNPASSKAPPRGTKPS